MMRLKNLLKGLLGMMLFLISPWAGAGGVSDCPFCGFYYGLSLGLGLNVAKAHTLLNTNFSFPAFQQSINRTGLHYFERNTFDMGLYLGYSISSENIYIAAEGFVDRAGYRTTRTETIDVPFTRTTTGNFNNVNSAIQFTTKLKPLTYGIDLRPGLFINDNALLFARFGIGRNRLSFNAIITNNNTVIVPPNTEVFPGSLTISHRKPSNTYRFGGGLEHVICGNFSLRAEYIYAYYPKFRSSNTLIIPLTPALVATSGTVNLFSNSHVKVSQHSVRLGLTYYW